VRLLTRVAIAQRADSKLLRFHGRRLATRDARGSTRSPQESFDAPMHERNSARQIP
jgi:hypothetical protein